MKKLLLLAVLVGLAYGVWKYLEKVRIRPRNIRILSITQREGPERVDKEK